MKFIIRQWQFILSHLFVHYPIHIDRTVSRILITQPYQECYTNGGNPGCDGLFHKKHCAG